MPALLGMFPRICGTNVGLQPKPAVHSPASGRSHPPNPPGRAPRTNSASRDQHPLAVDGHDLAVFDGVALDVVAALVGRALALRTASSVLGYLAAKLGAPGGLLAVVAHLPVEAVGLRDGALDDREENLAALRGPVAALGKVVGPRWPVQLVRPIDDSGTAEAPRPDAAPDQGAATASVATQRCLRTQDQDCDLTGIIATA